jgi:hypothetical protein
VSRPADLADGSLASDLALLRRFEPVVRYTRGEEFLQAAVEPYVEACSLWCEHPGGRTELLVPWGALTTERLAQSWPQEPGSRLYLTFSEPLSLAELIRQRLKAGAPSLRAPENRFRPSVGRLALPASPASLRARRLVELWAAASIALFLLVTLLILALARQWAVLGIAGLLTVFVFIEALLRRQLARLVASFTVLLAVVAAGVLVVTFFWTLVFLTVLTAHSSCSGGTCASSAPEHVVVRVRIGYNARAQLRTRGPLRARGCHAANL